jgi:leucyl-tRNA synthetase
MKRYNPKDIEPKWQKYWESSSIYTANLGSDKPKYIAMSMFNYPSGAGIHLGHALNYTISDVKARFKRQQGYESYHPVGWDSFGLPAENYAIKAGVSPQVSMATIIPSYHKQYKAMGWSNDWEKEIATHLPEYYKWTQWIFSQMYKNGLAYQDSRSQWWCDSCQTVLANEQIVDGKCWRHDSVDDPIVEKREVKQWFFRITDYADELLEAIDDLDWTESVKLSQKNWIGKSTGAEITFTVENSEKEIAVFTTRPDTIFGATFIVLAPENDLVSKLVTDEQKDQVEAYIHQAVQKSEVERQASKEKSGVFTGAYAVNPASQQKVPIWIADYVLEGYGTGAIMAVPAHDERDYEFASKYGLQIIRVIKNDAPDDACTHEPGTLINSGEFNDKYSEEAKKSIIDWLQKSDKAQEKINYKMRDWSVTRQRYWGAPTPIIHCKDCGPVLVPDEELPVILPELEDFAPSGDGRSALARASDWLVADCPNCGKQGERETDTLDTYICSSWYMLRYFDPSNQEKAFSSEVANKWMPIDFYNGGDHATAHLLYARFVTRFFTKIGLLENPEPFKQMLYNGKVTASDGTMFSKSKGNGVDPLEIINSGYGADALRTYLMFASPLELWTKWDPQGVPGTYRFLTRLWNLVQEYTETQKGTLSEENKKLLLRSSHMMIQKVTQDLEDNHYNTAIAATMGYLNELYKAKSVQFVQNQVWQDALEAIVMAVAPFAPHIADELWQDLGHSISVHVDNWPVFNESYIESTTMKLAVQVNGRVRAEIEVSTDTPKEKIEAVALAQENVLNHLEGREPKKVIYVEGRLVSIVV